MACYVPNRLIVATLVIALSTTAVGAGTSLDSNVANGAVVSTTGAWHSPQSIYPGGFLGGLSCPTRGFGVAVGRDNNANQADALIYNGSSWSAPVTIAPGEEGDIVAVSCPTTHFCGAVGPYGEALTYNGTNWSAPE